MLREAEVESVTALVGKVLYRVGSLLAIELGVLGRRQRSLREQTSEGGDGVSTGPHNQKLI
jgi:hypothetical protein